MTDPRPPPKPSGRGRNSSTWRVDESTFDARLPDELSADQITQLKTSLGDNWVDSDTAQFTLGKCLAVFDQDSSFDEKRYIFWTDNPINTKLMKLLQDLVDNDALESRTTPDYQFKVKMG